jgi:Fibronectin type III domain
MTRVQRFSRTFVLTIAAFSLISSQTWPGMLARAQSRRVSLGTFDPPTDWRVETIKISSDGKANGSDSQSANRLPNREERTVIAEGPALGLSVAPKAPTFGYEVTSFLSQRGLAFSSDAVRISSDRGELIARAVQSQQATADAYEKTIEFFIYGNVDGNDYVYDYQFVYSGQTQRILRGSATSLRGDGYEVDYTNGESFRLTATKDDTGAKLGQANESLGASSTSVANTTSVDIACIINNLMECSTYIGLLELGGCVLTGPAALACLTSFLQSILINAFCGITTNCTPRPSFSLSATPSPITIRRGESGSFSVQATFTGGFSGPVSGFDVTNLPSGVTRSNSPGAISSNGGRVTLSLNASASAAIGSRIVTISATGGGKTKTTTAQLNIDLGRGTIQINASVNGSIWNGSLTWALTGVGVAGGTSVPRTLPNMTAGSYGLTFLLGGPPNAAFIGVSPSSPSLTTGTTGTFTLNFVTAPVAPANLTGTATSSSRVSLSWNDNSSNETGFRVDRKRTASGSWGPIASVGSGVRTYSDSGLSSNTTYVYRVVATNQAGPSAYSNERSVTTPR